MAKSKKPSVWKAGVRYTLLDPAELKIALENGANPNECRKHGVFPLYRADREQGDLLFAYGAEINAVWEHGTVLHDADYAKTEWCLERGANPNIPDAVGNSPLHRAPYEIQILLLAHGADATLRNIRGQTPYEMRYERMQQLGNTRDYQFLKEAEDRQTAAKTKNMLLDGLDVPFIGTQQQEQRHETRRRM